MLQLLARASFFSHEDLQHSSHGHGVPLRGPHPRGTSHAGGILATSVPLPLVSAKLVAVSFFYRVEDVAILELLNFFHFESEWLN